MVEASVNIFKSNNKKIDIKIRSISKYGNWFLYKFLNIFFQIYLMTQLLFVRLG